MLHLQKGKPFGAAGAQVEGCWGAEEESWARGQGPGRASRPKQGEGGKVGLYGGWEGAVNSLQLWQDTL